MFKEKLKNNPIVCWTIYNFKALYSLITKNKCSHQSEMSKYKNIYLNQTCFIVATGPSLTIEDLELLKGQHCISVNSIVKSFDKTTWRPDYLVVSDPIPFSALKDYIHDEDFKQIFLAAGIGEYEGKATRFRLYNFQRAKCQANGSFLHRLYPDDNLDNYFVNTPSSIFSAIQLAYFMGFRKIYLLGQDCSFGKGMAHSNVASVKYKVDPKAKDAENIIDVFCNFKEWADKNGLEIYNATRGGYLEIFPRVVLEDVIKTINNGGNQE